MPITTKAANRYIPTINGTTFSVTAAILLRPPMITKPTQIAITIPNISPEAPPVKPAVLLKIIAAWLD